MADTVLFRGAFIRSFNYKNAKDSRHTKIEFTADWTDKIREAMKWPEVPEGYEKVDLIGKLSASHMILTPSKRELRDHEFQIEIDEATDFTVIPTLDKKGEVKSRELRFAITSTSKGCAAKVEAYCQKMGREAAQLKVSYVVQEVFADAETQADVVD